jgi:anti-sigma factor RsiW
MSDRRETVTELDLHAYADGRLDRDPARRAEVERFLDTWPQQAERIAAFRAQNEALRRLGDPWLGAPVPPRLLDALYAEPTRPLGAAIRWRAAAAAALIVASAAGGWMAGANGPRGDNTLALFARDALSDHAAHSGPAAFASASAPESGVATQGVVSPGLATGAAAPLSWLTDRVAVEIRIPDLGDQGYTLVANERVRLDGGPAVRLGYRRSDGRTANIYLRPRWEDHSAPMERVTAANQVALHWLDGPLAVALIADDSSEGEADALAASVHRAIARAAVSEPPVAVDGVSQDVQLIERAVPGPVPLDIRNLDVVAPSMRVN